MKARLTTIASGSAQMCVASRNMATAAIEAANFYKRCTATLDPDHANENEMLVIASQAQATARTSCVN